MVNLHPDFYTMTFKLKPAISANSDLVVEKLQPLATYYHNGELFVVCINSVDNGLVDVQLTWLMAD